MVLVQLLKNLSQVVLTLPVNFHAAWILVSWSIFATCVKHSYWYISLEKPTVSSSMFSSLVSEVIIYHFIAKERKLSLQLLSVKKLSGVQVAHFISAFHASNCCDWREHALLILLASGFFHTISSTVLFHSTKLNKNQKWLFFFRKISNTIGISMLSWHSKCDQDSVFRDSSS